MNSEIVYIFSATGLEGVADGAAGLLGAGFSLTVAVADRKAEVCAATGELAGAELEGEELVTGVAEAALEIGFVTTGGRRWW